MVDLDFEFSAELWIWQAEKGAWHFLDVPPEMSEDIKAFTQHLARGFRSVKVEAQIGSTVWRTSIFPSKERGGYILPVKKSVRDAEGLLTGKTCAVKLRVPT